jgi:outer membrane immunogenic protein
MKKILPVFGVLGVFWAACPAMAGDMGTPNYKTPATVVGYRWSGFYIGAHGGYGWKTAVNTGISTDGDPTNDAGSIPGSLVTNPAGFMGGGQLGYNLQTGGLVFGLETDLSYAHFVDSASAAPVVPAFDIKNTQVQQTTDMLGTLRGRIGWAPFERSLFYATGGLAYGHVTLSNSIISIGGACSGAGFCTSASASKIATGYAVGGGWENMLTDNLSAKAEYLYYDLGSVSLVDPPTSGVVFRANNAVFKGSIVRVGLNYRLGCATSQC